MATTQLAGPVRLQFVDNLRALTIALVVTMHAAVTYSNFGRWYYMEPPPKDMPTLILFGMYQSFLQAWFMGFLFFLAGYFVPSSYDRKGARRFIADRAIRLGVPSLIYMALIHPFIDLVMVPLFRRGDARSAGSWLRYFSSTRFLEGTGPMWFAVALLIFSLVYAGVRMVSRTRPTALPPPGNRAIALLILAISVCTFFMRTWQPLGGAVLNMQLGYFSQYIILFVAGIQARRGNWLSRIPYPFGVGWLTAAATVGVVMWLAIIAGGGALSGVDFAVFNGGWHWQSAAIAFWESFVCTGTCLGLIVLFRDRLNTENRTTRFLIDNAFAVYVFHPPLLIAVTMALHPWSAPALVRFAAASVLAIAISFAAAHYVFRRVPLLKNVL